MSPRQRAQAQPPQKLRVADGTQVNIDGGLYTEGQTFEAPARTATRLIARGIASPVEDKPTSAKS